MFGVTSVHPLPTNLCLGSKMEIFLGDEYMIFNSIQKSVKTPYLWTKTIPELWLEK